MHPPAQGDYAWQSEDTDFVCTREATVAEEGQKQDPPVSDSRAMMDGMAPIAARQETRENEDTRTPSSCSDEKAGSSNGNRCDDIEDHFVDDALTEALHRKPVRSQPVPATTLDTETTGIVPSEEGGGSQPLSESGPPSAALIPHLSMPRMRGPRPAPTLGGRGGFGATDLQASCPSGRKGPLGALINWLDDADVGDVLERYPLPDVSELVAKVNTTHPFPDVSSPNPGFSGCSNQFARQGLTPPVAGDGSQRRVVPHMPPRESSPRAFQDNHFGDQEEDDLEEVPSDKEALPRAPPLAPSSVTLMRPLTPDQRPMIDTDQHRPSGYCANPTHIIEGHNEEEEWVARQRLTGAICRLVRYNEDALTPKDDILNLRSTRRGRIMVTAVRDKGIAAKAGVVAGDELVSIDGRKDFVGHPAHVVHASLRAPCTLVFLGFVGKLQAEVRVKRPPEPRLGLAVGNDVILSEGAKAPQPLRLCDAVVFQQGDSPSLLITAGAVGSEPARSSLYDGSAPEVKPSEPMSKTIMYELQREDARNLLVNAMVTTAAL